VLTAGARRGRWQCPFVNSPLRRARWERPQGIYASAQVRSGVECPAPFEVGQPRERTRLVPDPLDHAPSRGRDGRAGPTFWSLTSPGGFRTVVLLARAMRPHEETWRGDSALGPLHLTLFAAWQACAPGSRVASSGVVGSSAKTGRTSRRSVRDSSAARHACCRGRASASTPSTHRGSGRMARPEGRRRGSRSPLPARRRLVHGLTQDPPGARRRSCTRGTIPGSLTRLSPRPRASVPGRAR
jgi:hypothetical protein